MLEKQLASSFNQILGNYRILTMTIKQGGLPDKAIQLQNGKVVWFELKVVAMPPVAATLRISNLDSIQAAWLSNWQRYGGDCYLFLGVLNKKLGFFHYGILQCEQWRDWLQVPNRSLPIDELVLLTPKNTDVLNWFRSKYGMPHMLGHTSQNVDDHQRL